MLRLKKYSYIHAIIIFCILFCFIFWRFPSLSYAYEKEIDEYELIFNRVNEQYKTNLGYNKVDSSKISLDEYKILVNELAKNQRELLDYLENREELIGEDVYETNTITTKTVSKSPNNCSQYFKIEVTYDVDGIYVSNPRDVSLRRTPIGIFSGCIFNIYPGYPTTSVIDSRRTITVKYVGAYNCAGVSIDNVMLYAEFYFNS